MVAWNVAEEALPNANAAPVRPGNAVPSGPVLAGAPPLRLVACGACEAEVPAERFCCACGRQLAPTSCACGVDLPTAACFCAACGKPT